MAKQKTHNQTHLLKRILLAIAITIIAAILVLIFLVYNNSEIMSILSYIKLTNYQPYVNSYTPPASVSILFYSDDCSHCTKVDAFIKNNKIEDKITFTRLNVSNSATNVNMLEDKVQTCGLDQRYVATPFFWDDQNKKCIVGDVDIIKFFTTVMSSKKL